MTGAVSSRNELRTVLNSNRKELINVMTGRVRTFAVIALIALIGAGCGDKAPESGDGAVRLVATTGHIGDALKAITKGAGVELKLLCGPGVDPHSYSASTGDVKAMEDASLIVWNGFHLEAQLESLLEGTFKDKAWAMSSVFPSSERLDWVEDGEVDPKAPYDPHIWNHLEGWATCVEGLAERLAKLDPPNATAYRTNGAAYAKEVRDAHGWAKTKLAEIPADRRFLVSGHDAFNYFAKAYGLETVAVLGVGNDQEADIQTMRDVAKTIAARKVPVIFMESLTNPKITQALQEASESLGWKVKIADDSLYSDDLGESPPQDTYLGAFRSNVDLIHAALK